MTDPKSSPEKVSPAADANAAGRSPARRHINVDTPRAAPRVRDEATPASAEDAPAAESAKAKVEAPAAESAKAKVEAPAAQVAKIEAPAKVEAAAGAPAEGKEVEAEAPARARRAPPEPVRATILHAAPAAEDDDTEAVLRLPGMAEVAELLEAQPIKAGSLLRASVTAVSAEAITLSLEGDRSQGAIPPAKVSPREFDTAPAVGDAFHAYVNRVTDDGTLSVSPAKARALALWDRLLSAAKDNASVEGRVLAEQRGGVSVEVEGLKAFCPRRQLDLAHGQQPVDLIGETLTFKVTAFDPRRADLLLSRRATRPARRRDEEAPAEGAEGAAEGAAEPREPRAAREAREPAAPREPVELPEEGAVLEGEVRSITDYGAFVQVGEISGLLPVSELSWGRVNHPRDVLSQGQSVTVKVLKVEADKNRIRFSIKALQDDPWLGADARLPEGTKVSGTVIALTKFGAFVEVEPGVEGLVHTSELSWTRRVNSPGEVVAVGDTLPLVVLRIDAGARKLGLSLKAAAGNPYAQLLDQFPVGSRLKGTIRNLTDFGVFVAIAEGIDGLVHRGDLSWHEPSPDPRSAFKVGESIEVMVLDIDTERQRIALGVKQLAADAEPAPGDSHGREARPDPRHDARFDALTVGEMLAGEAVRVVDFGAFVALPNGLEGLLHRSELRDAPVEDATTVITAGEALQVRVVAVDARRRRISLSLKPAAEAPAEVAAEIAAEAPAEVAAEVAADAPAEVAAEASKSPAE
jgi:small subunit ribosomal protein S1